MAAEVLGQSLHRRRRTADEKYDLMRILASHFPLVGNHADGRCPCRGLSGPFPFCNAWQPASRPRRLTPASPRVSEPMVISLELSSTATWPRQAPIVASRHKTQPCSDERTPGRTCRAMGCRWEVREIAQTRSASSGPNRSTSVQPSAPQIADGRA